MKLTTMHVIPTCAALALLSGTSAMAAEPQDETNTWDLSLFGGNATALRGTLRGPGSVAFPDTSVTLMQHRLDYDDAFTPSYDTGLEVNYNVDGSLQFFGRFDYDALNGRDHRIGEALDSVAEVVVPERARFDDTHDRTFELGSRYFWMSDENWRPFFSAALGVTRMGAAAAKISFPGSELIPEEVKFTRAADVFSQNVGVGLEYRAAENLSWRFGVDAQHMATPQTAHDPALTQLGFDDHGDQLGDSWSYPISIAAEFRFQ